MATMTTEFREKEETIRGVKYTFRELSAGDYDSCLKIATGPNDETDFSVLLKLMVSKSLIEPKLSAEDLAAKPYPVIRKINDIVNRMHYGDDAGEAEAATEKSAAS